MQTPSRTIFRLCNWIIGADFYRAMVATAAWEKLLTGHRPVRNWTQLRYQACSVQKITCILRKINKNCCHQSCIFDSNMHQMVCRRGLHPCRPTGGAYSAPFDPLAVFRGPTSKGRGGRKFVLCPRKKKKRSRRLWTESYLREMFCKFQTSVISRS